MKKKLTGTVKKAAMTKSAVVTVNRIVVHPKYKKRTKKTRSYIVHNELKAKAGDKVQIEEIKPMSRHKRFSIIKIIK
ncbi:mitochondrial small ribosomal subunit protein uS17m [Patescibacteria group bacterium]|nr:mitochondrial small ribosomal subunit protein uS17m [Patescibacteria group bacterium]MBU1199993.1 mitochondrial small ribosomal subunit protein uS17m [Patescibacteria group bacterium]